MGDKNVETTVATMLLCVGLLVGLSYTGVHFPHPLVPVAVVGLLLVLADCLRWLWVWGQWRSQLDETAGGGVENDRRGDNV